MRKHLLLALCCALLFVLPTAAQEQRGSIEGVIKDASGAVMPGALVEAKSPTGVTFSATTDASGGFRLPSLPPGTYNVTASLPGFTTKTVEDVNVYLGQIKKVDFMLPVSGVAETVMVTAVSPLIDIRQSARAANIRSAQIDLLPHNRDFSSLIVQAPGANQENKSGGIMIDGASGAENRYIIDGIETTNVLNGVSGKDLLADFVEEVQVKSTGYPAEYGGSTGGVVNVLTKSGTNSMSGSMIGVYQGSKVAGESNQTLRAVFGVPTRAEYWTYPKDENRRLEGGGTLGGPIVQNKAWFFAAYQPSYTEITRTVSAATSGIASATPSVTVQKPQTQNFSVNGTNQFGNKLRTRVAFNDSWSQTDGQLAALTGADSPTTIYTKGTKYPNWSLSGTADYVVSDKLVIGARLGRYLSDAADFNVNNVVRYFFADGTTNIGQAGVPASLQHPAGYTNIGSNNGIAFDTTTRNFFQADATYYAKMGSSTHQVKFGVQIDHRGNDVINGSLQNTINIRWATPNPFDNRQGAFGYYEVVSAGPSAYQQGFATTGNVRSNVNGVFVQDAWSVTSRLTINAGVRTENENVPTYSTGTDVLVANPISFAWKDKVAPRAGFAYDVTGDGTNKIYGSWGIFYDIFKLNMPRGSFGGDKWTSYYYTLDTPNFETLRDSSSCPPTCPGTFITSRNFRLPSQTPGLDVEQTGQLKPMRSQELSFGYERQINARLAATVRYVHKQLDRAIDDIGDLAAGDEAYIIANPGEGLVDVFDISTGTAVFRPQGFAKNPVLITMPTATRFYNSVELAVIRRLGNNWMFNGSYMWSKDAGNYSGLASSDEPNAAGNGRLSANNARDFDYPSMSFDQTGAVLDGVLDTDRTHQIKAQGLYQFTWGTSVGINAYLESGTPITRQVPIIAGSNYPIRYLGRGSEGRTPMFSQADLFVAHSIKIGGGRNVELSMNVLNLFNQRVVTNRISTVRRSGAIPLATGYYEEAAFYAGKLNFDQLTAKAVANGVMTLNPQFGMDSLYQPPIQARFNVKFRF
jgi:hypothetical protein